MKVIRIKCCKECPYSKVDILDICGYDTDVIGCNHPDTPKDAPTELGYSIPSFCPLDTACTH